MLTLDSNPSKCNSPVGCYLPADGHWQLLNFRQKRKCTSSSIVSTIHEKSELLHDRKCVRIFVFTAGSNTQRKYAQKLLSMTRNTLQSKFKNYKIVANKKKIMHRIGIKPFLCIFSAQLLVEYENMNCQKEHQSDGNAPMQDQNDR